MCLGTDTSASIFVIPFTSPNVYHKEYNVLVGVKEGTFCNKCVVKEHKPLTFSTYDLSNFVFINFGLS